MADLPFNFGEYQTIRQKWPKTGNHIMGFHNDETILLYWATDEKTAGYAVAKQTFANFKSFDMVKMKHLKSTFLLTMFGCQWAEKEDENRILAFSVKREGFEEILRQSQCPLERLKEKPEVILSWEEDHLPSGDDLERSAIQLSVRLSIFERLYTEWLVKIDDVTHFVNEQRVNALEGNLNQLLVPEETVYKLMDESLAPMIQLEVDYKGDYEEEEDII